MTEGRICASFALVLILGGWLPHFAHAQMEMSITPVCDRTQQVRDAIVAAVSGIDACANVTETHLMGITRLNTSFKNITALQDGDFSGLSSLQKLFIVGNPLTSVPANLFAGLSSLQQLRLDNNSLGSLDKDIFAGLSSLQTLALNHNQLTSLDRDIFAGLSSLRALSLSGNRLTSLDKDIFDGLSSLIHLALDDNKLTSLPANVFDGPSSLTLLSLSSNQLSSLPDGLFSGLSSLEELFMEGNSVDPLSLTVSLERVGTNQVKAVAPTGAPFTLVLPLNITSGSISGGATTITIPQGSVESSPLTVTRTPGTTGAVTVDIGVLPTPPSSDPQSHEGYRLVKSAALPLEAIGAPTVGGNGGVGRGSSGGGGGGGGGSSQDQHGDTPSQATPVSLAETAPWASSTTGHINTADDIDYFTMILPYAGVLVVETIGRTDTKCTVWQAGEELDTAASGGMRRNCRLSVPVDAGTTVIAVEGRTGAYTLETILVVGFLENPGPDSFQSGIGVLSGWTCAAELVEIEINGEAQPAAYGTERIDTEPICGDTDNGFGLLFNWNRLGDGAHEVVALVDEVEIARATVTVTTLGTEFLEGVAGECMAADFPMMGEGMMLMWQQNQQNFVIVDGRAPTEATQTGTAGVGYLENPGPNSFQSGVGVISGWVCEAAQVEIILGDLAPMEAGYGTERLDTEETCGDTDNGFGLLFNWNRLGDGEHSVIARVNGEELGRTVVRVTTLGVEFLENTEGLCEVTNFPMTGQTVTLEWQQTSQNFVITGVE